MPDWKDDLESQVDEAIASKSKRARRRKKTLRTEKVQKSTFVNKLTDGSFNLPTFLVICILTITLIASYNWKSFGSVFAHRGHRSNFQYQEQWDQYKQQEEVRRREYEDRAEEAIRETYHRAKTNSDKLTLLGILYNNNTAAARAGRRDYIFLNGDWTIDRMPTYLSLDEEDRVFLRKYVKKS